MKNEFIFKHTINTYEVDFKKDIKLNSLFMLLQEAATRAAMALGVGQSELEPLNTAWVLSRVQVNLKKIPVEFDEITILTWPVKPMFSFHPRCFQILDKEDNVIGEVNTIWTLLDLKERNISKVDLFSLGFPNDLEERPIIPSPRKIDTSKVELIKKYYPLYSDLDVNNHVNNTKYISWMMDLLPMDEIKNMKVKSITTNYIHELKYKDEVKLCYIKEENVYTFAFKKSDEVCFSAIIEIERD